MITKMFCFAICGYIASCFGHVAVAQEEILPKIQHGFSVRIKDITSVDGMSPTTISGFGLVSGLSNTGAKNPTTRQAGLNVLEKYGLRADPKLRESIRNDAQEKTNSLSLVRVVAEIQPFTGEGSKVDVTVSVWDDASSLQGGVLSETALIGIDGEVIAMAQGSLTIGGFSASGQAATVTKNHQTVGRIPNGATVKKEICAPDIGFDGTVKLMLRQPDFENARRITAAISQKLPGTAYTPNPGTVLLRVPRNYRNNVIEFVSQVQALRVVPDMQAKVVINERTGTVIIGDNVRLSRVGITHAGLSVITGESPQVVQPAPFSQGKTAIVPRTDLDVFEGQDFVRVIDESATVGELARALNALGATPRDLSAIFQALKSNGALHAELEFN